MDYCFEEQGDSPGGGGVVGGLNLVVSHLLHGVKEPKFDGSRIFALTLFFFSFVGGESHVILKFIYEYEGAVLFFIKKNICFMCV